MPIGRVLEEGERLEYQATDNGVRSVATNSFSSPPRGQDPVLSLQKKKKRKKMRVAAARLIRSGRHWRPLSNFLLKKKKVSGELIPNIFFIING